MRTKAEFAEEVQRNWENPLGLGKIVFDQTRQDGRFAPNDDAVERAIEIGMIIADSRKKGPAAFLKAYEEMAMTALCE